MKPNVEIYMIIFINVASIRDSLLRPYCLDMIPYTSEYYMGASGNSTNLKIYNFSSNRIRLTSFCGKF